MNKYQLVWVEVQVCVCRTRMLFSQSLLLYSFSLLKKEALNLEKKKVEICILRISTAVQSIYWEKKKKYEKNIAPHYPFKN